MQTYDLIIVGAGPAGITAAVYAARKKLDFLILSKDIGGQAAWSGDIENYTGYQFITGPELSIKFQEHVEHFGISIRMPEETRRIEKRGDLIHTITDSEEYVSRSVIVATGKKPRMLEVPGEKEYKNKGVTYCATCDGPLFRGKSVAVIGGGNSGLDAALQLMHIAKKVYVINQAEQLTGDPVMIDKITASPTVEILNETSVKAINGGDFVNNIRVEQRGQPKVLAVEGIFVEIGLVPNSECVPQLQKNELGEIEVDCYNRTSCAGIYAAGDVTNVPEKQIIIACGEGSKACLSVFRYLSTHVL